METFAPFLDHVMKNFAVAYPYGLSKTEVTRLTFLAWCQNEASVFDGSSSPLKGEPSELLASPNAVPKG